MILADHDTNTDREMIYSLNWLLVTGGGTMSDGAQPGSKPN